jgi:acid phosphatase
MGALPMGALLTDMHGLHHPSQPNYFELFSGSAQGVCNDKCPLPGLAADNLAKALTETQAANDHRAPFLGYAEDLPTPATACGIKFRYGRKHCPWITFTNIHNVTRSFADFPANFDTLPRVAFVIPNLVHDMHNLPTGKFDTPTEVHQGDGWLRAKMDGYAHWALTHNSILIVTWDENSDEPPDPVKDDCSNAHPTQPPDNRIPTFIVGAHVKPKSSGTKTYTHLHLLRTIEDLAGTRAVGASKTVPPITGIWQ